MRDLRSIALLLLLTIAALAVFTHPVHADNGSFVIVTEPQGPVYPLNPPYRITQGQPVNANDTIDISGMGWGDGLAWYGHYSEYTEPQYIWKFTEYKHSLQNFWLNPAVFANRPGMWYQYYGSNATESHGNLEAFKVKEIAGPVTKTFPNGTIISEQIVSNTPIIPDEVKAPLLPEIHVSDYLLAKGDPLVINTGSSARVWIAGRVDGIYARETSTASATFSPQDLASFEPGTYTVLIQKPGKNTIYEVEYEPEHLTSPWVKVKPIDIIGLSPQLVMERLRMALEKTDDEYEIKKLEIQHPSLTINRMDEVGLGGRYYEFRNEPGLVTLMDIRGYTNLAPGTNITVSFDKEDWNTREIKYHRVNANVEQGTEPGNMRVFRAYVPMIWNDIEPGVMHTFTVDGPYGTFVNSDMPVHEMPADSYRPNATIRYAGDENPWKPNMTIPDPIIIEKEKVVIKEVIKEVAPSNETVYEQQEKAQHAVAWYWMKTILAIGFASFGLYFVMKYGLSIFRRLRE